MDRLIPILTRLSSRWTVPFTFSIYVPALYLTTVVVRIEQRPENKGPLHQQHVKLGELELVAPVRAVVLARRLCAKLCTQEGQILEQNCDLGIQTLLLHHIRELGVQAAFKF
jgi:hypothetical protein